MRGSLRVAEALSATSHSRPTATKWNDMRYAIDRASRLAASTYQAHIVVRATKLVRLLRSVTTRIVSLQKSKRARLRGGTSVEAAC